VSRRRWAPRLLGPPLPLPRGRHIGGLECPRLHELSLPETARSSSQYGVDRRFSFGGLGRRLIESRVSQADRLGRPRAASLHHSSDRREPGDVRDIGLVERMLLGSEGLSRVYMRGPFLDETMTAARRGAHCCRTGWIKSGVAVCNEIPCWPADDRQSTPENLAVARLSRRLLPALAQYDLKPRGGAGYPAVRTIRSSRCPRAKPPPLIPVTLRRTFQTSSTPRCPKDLGIPLRPAAPRDRRRVTGAGTASDFKRKTSWNGEQQIYSIRAMAAEKPRRSDSTRSKSGTGFLSIVASRNAAGAESCLQHDTFGHPDTQGSHFRKYG